MDNQLRFELLSNEYEIARSEAEKWKIMVYEKYINGEQHSIISMLAYLENIERGFGKHNDEKQYANIRKNDTSGRLFAETLRGFEFSKKYISIAPIIWQMKAREMMTKRNGLKSMYRKL
jgi:hypothetical protein